MRYKLGQWCSIVKAPPVFLPNGYLAIFFLNILLQQIFAVWIFKGLFWLSEVKLSKLFFVLGCKQQHTVHSAFLHNNPPTFFIKQINNTNQYSEGALFCAGFKRQNCLLFLSEEFYQKRPFSVQEAVTSAYFGETIDVSSYAFSSFSENSTQQPATHHSNLRDKTHNSTYRMRGLWKQSQIKKTHTHNETTAEHRSATS